MTDLSCDHKHLQQYMHTQQTLLYTLSINENVKTILIATLNVSNAADHLNTIDPLINVKIIVDIIFEHDNTVIFLITYFICCLDFDLPTSILPEWHSDAVTVIKEN